MARKPPNESTSKIYYIHLRYKEDDGSVSNSGGITVAYRDRDKHHIEVAFSRCNLKDNFRKSIGRAIATANLNWENCWIIDKPSDERSACHEAAIELVS